jgi:phosphoesterase RecJ-like protein
VVAETPQSLLPSDLAAVPAEVPERMLQARRVMLVCHENPDGDALGSALGVGLALESLGARVNLVCVDPVPPMYDYMPQAARFKDAPDADLDPDLIVVCDCGDLGRAGAVVPQNGDLFERVPIINIDHHVSNPGFGTVDWVDADSAATCEQVALLLPHLGVSYSALDGEIIQNLTTGLVFDTANFAHSNTTPRTLRVASEMVAVGAELPMIARRIYRTKPDAQLRLFGRVLARLETTADGLLIWSMVNEADYEAAGATPQMAEGLIDLLAQSATAEVAMLFKDVGAQTRISVRTRDGGIDATVLTGTFGGGGHARAAGATVDLSFAEAKPVVLEVAQRLLNEMPPR